MEKGMDGDERAAVGARRGCAKDGAREKCKSHGEIPERGAGRRLDRPEVAVLQELALPVVVRPPLPVRKAPELYRDELRAVHGPFGGETRDPACVLLVRVDRREGVDDEQPECEMLEQRQVLAVLPEDLRKFVWL